MACSHTWTQVHTPLPIPPARKMHSAVLSKDRVLVMGGEKDGAALDDVYSLKLPAWQPGQPLGRAGGGATALEVNTWPEALAHAGPEEQPRWVVRAAACAAPPPPLRGASREASLSPT